LFHISPKGIRKSLFADMNPSVIRWRSSLRAFWDHDEIYSLCAPRDYDDIYSSR